MRKSDIQYIQISLFIPMVSPWYPHDIPVGFTLRSYDYQSSNLG